MIQFSLQKVAINQFIYLFIYLFIYDMRTAPGERCQLRLRNSCPWLPLPWWYPCSRNKVGRLRQVLAIPRSWNVCLSAKNWYCLSKYTYILTKKALLRLRKRKRTNIREFKPHIYGKRQTSDSSWEFLKIENEQIKTAQNKSYWIKNCVKLLFMCRNNKQ